MSRSRRQDRRAGLLASLLATALLGGLLPAAAAAEPAGAPAGSLTRSAEAAAGSDDRAGPSDPAGEPPVQPSIAYLEAMAHEGDRIAFEPGGIVDVPFAPRAADGWPVGGAPPVALPAGRATGREMAASPNGSLWTAIEPRAGAGPDPAIVPIDAGQSDPDAPVDRPAGRAAMPATLAGRVVPASQPVTPQAASGLRRQVFGFLPYWELSGAASTLNWDVLSTVAYFSVGATKRGDLRKRSGDGSLTTGWAGWTSSNLTRVINEAHRHGTRVVLTVSVFAWTSSQADIQRGLLGSAAARQNLARQAAAAVRDRGADGVNLDFEPLASGYEDEFVAFLRAMRSELNRVGPGYQLTYDTTGSIGNYPLEASVGADAADAIFVMGYDYRSSGSATAGSIDPLSGPKYDLTDTVRSYVARVGASRLILGLPWYGRAWSTVSDAPRSENQSGARYGYSTAVTYEAVTALVDRHGRRWDKLEQSPYIAYRRENCSAGYGCVTSWREVYYEDEASLKLRLAMVNEYGLRGAGMWALGYDGGHAGLYRAYAESLLVDKAAPRAGIRMLTATQVDEGFVVRWAARDTSRIVSYDVEVAVGAGPWTPWLTATTATSDVWLGGDGTGYAFRVRARDSKGNLGPWNVTSTWEASPGLVRGGFGRVVTDGLAYRTGPDTSAARLGTLAAGTIVAVTRGPVSSDGHAWYEVTQPIREWTPVSFVERGVWVAASSPSNTHVEPYRAPNTTLVAAGLVGLDFGTGASAVGDSEAAVAARAFSPDGDGSQDGIRLRWTNARALDSLVLRVYRPGGRLLGSVDAPRLGAGSQGFAWDGRLAGSRVEDGRYVLQLVGMAGSRRYTAPSVRPVTPVQVARYAVTVDTVDPVRLSASATTTLISPNGDGRLDATTLSLVASGATRWTARIIDAGGATVRSVTREGGSGSITWQGTDDGGARLPDGRYRATLAAWDDAGNAVSRAWTLTIDTTAPAVGAGGLPALFSPNGDGDADTTILGWTSDEPGSARVRLLLGTTRIRAWTVAPAMAWSTTWDGRRADGSRAPDGRYTLEVRIQDAAGNRRTVTGTVVVDRTASTLRWSGPFFPQDGDALQPKGTLSWRLTRDATTTLRIHDRSGNEVRTAWTDREQRAGARAWTWDGRAGDGSFVSQGTYTARLTVRSRFGTAVLERDVVVGAFVATLSASRVEPGQTLTVRFASVEPLAGLPMVRLRQPGLAGVTVSAKRLADGSYRAAFVIRAGAAGEGSIRISGTDTAGGRNVTTLPIRVRLP